MAPGFFSRAFFASLYREMKSDDVFTGAAALGFWLTLAMFPAMVVLMALIPYLPIADVDRAIMDLLHQALPRSAADMFSGVVDEVTGEQRSGVLSLGLVGTFWAASAGMYAVMQQLNNTYDVEEDRSVLKGRATALGLSLMFGAMVLGAFSLIVLGGVLQDWIGNRFGFSEALLGFFVVFRWAVILLGLLLGFSLVYHFGPNLDQQFRFATPGSVVAVLLLVSASLVFKLYVSNFGRYSATYGSIGAVIVLMLWLYMAGLVLLLGSEVNVVVEGRRARVRHEPAARASGSEGASSPRGRLQPRGS